MFWKRKEPKIVFGGLGPTFEPMVPVEPKKEFANMYDLLFEAERLDNIEEYGLSDDVLRVLVKYVNEHIKL